GKVRHVGEAVAMCAARTRAEAEDLAAQVAIEYEELPAVVNPIRARDEPPALGHEEWGDNVCLETLVEDDLEQVRRSAAVCVKRHLKTARQAMSPLEGRGVLAEWNERLHQLEMV